MAVTQVQTRNSFGNSATPAPNLSSAPTAGNLMVLFMAWKSTATFTTPTGWTLAGTADYTPSFNLKMVAIYKIATNTDNGTVSTTLSAASDYCFAMYEYSGQDATTPVNGSFFNTQNAASVSIVSPAPSVNSCYPVAAFSNTAGHTVSGLASGWTQDNLETSSTVIYIESQHGPLTSGTSTTTAQLTWGTSAATVAGILLIAPAGSSGITQVQNHSGTLAATSSITASLSSGPTAGNLLLVFVSWKSSATLSVPNGWNLIGTADYTPTYNLKQAVLWKKSAGGDGSVTLSVSATSDMCYDMYELSGQDSTTPINGSTFRTAHTQNMSITSPIPSQLNCYPVAGFVNSASHTVSGMASGWAQDSLTTATLYQQTQHGPLTTSTSASVTATLSWDNIYYSAYSIVLIQPPTSASGTISLSPTSLMLTYNSGEASFTATRTNYSGSITASTSDQSVATVIGGGTGSPQSFQVLRQITDGSGGTCTITITCADGVTNTLAVTVFGDLIINSTSNTFQPTGTISVSENNFTGLVTCTLQNQVANPPTSPSASSTAGGAIAATTYYIKTTYVNSFGETPPSNETSFAVAANNLLVVNSPAAVTNATSYNVYVSTATGTETKQNATPIAIGTNWTEPTSGLVAGTSPPSTNTTDMATVSPVSQNAASTTAITFTFTPTNIAYGSLAVKFTDANGVAVSETILVTGPLTVSVSTLNLNTSSGSVTFTASEAADSNSIVASSSNTAVATVAATTVAPGATTFTATPVGAGTCTFTVDDTHGSTATVNVTVAGPLSLSIVNMTFTDPKSAAQTSTVSGGTSPYTVSSSNTSIATVSIATSTVTVTPQGQGTCTITVTDSASPAAKATISVSVGLPLFLPVTTTTVGVGKSVTLSAQNGRTPYTSSSSNTAVATTSVSGTGIIINGVAAGTATITVTDADSETATITATVVSGITVSPTSLTFSTVSSASQNLTLSGGTAPYSVYVPAQPVASGSVSGTTATISPTAPGSGSVTVVDAANNSTTVPVSVGYTSTTSTTINFASPHDNAKSVTLSGGSGYTFTNSNTNIATFVLSGSSGICRPVSPGTCTITILDTQGDKAVITVTVASVPSTIPTWTDLQTKQAVKFYDPSNTSNSFSPQINPVTVTLKPNNVRKYTETTNSTSVILGSREYPPKEISLTWSAMDAADYEAFRLMQYITPLVYVDNNDQGYLGVLVFDEVEQLSGVSKKVYKVMASFLVIGPYNGQANILNQLTPPILAISSTPTTGGYISGGTQLWFWSTVTTPFGESIVGTSTPVTVGNTTSTNYIALSFVAPGSTWYRKTRIYWATSNSPSTATLLTEILAGQSNSFNVYTNYVAYSTLNPPTYGTAFTGYFSGGKWVATT